MLKEERELIWEGRWRGICFYFRVGEWAEPSTSTVPIFIVATVVGRREGWVGLGWVEAIMPKKKKKKLKKKKENMKWIRSRAGAAGGRSRR